MRKNRFFMVGTCLLLAVLYLPRPGLAAEAEEYQAVLDRYCSGCHNDRLQTAGLTLDGLDLEHVAAGAETWEKVIRKLRAREMPPPRRPRPDEATYVEFVDWIETELDRSSLRDPNPGTETIHRLNRTRKATPSIAA